MDKKVFYQTIAFCWFCLYLGFCVIAADADPFNWSEPIRGVFVILCGFSIIIAVIAGAEHI